MAAMSHFGRLVGFSFLVFLLLQKSNARIHKLKLENEDRTQIDLSTFGFLKGGYLAVKISDFSVSQGKNTEEAVYGFTLDKTVSTGISPYLEGRQETCILQDTSIRNDENVSVLFLRMDFKSKSLRIGRKGDDLKYLNISQLTEDEFLSHQRDRRSIDVFSDTYLLKSRARRDVAENGKTDKDPSTTTNAKQITEKKDDLMAGTKDKVPTPAPKATKATKTTAAKSKGDRPNATDKGKKELPNDTKKKSEDKTEPKVQAAVQTTLAPVASTAKPAVDYLKLVNDTIPMERDSNGKYHAHFLVLIKTEEEQGLYNLFFHNCFRGDDVRTTVNFTVNITENNGGNFLSAGEMPLPVLYFALSIIYLLTGGYWFYVLRSSESGTVFKIHYLMLVLVFVKAIALFFHSINFYFIQKEGHHEEAFAILYYITHLMKGALLFITIVLIGAGWAFVKHILSDRDKKIFIIVIPLQILANVAQIIIEETEEGQSQYTTWKEVFILVDLLCCGAILFPVVWSIRHLQEASATDGKAAINLAKLKIFRHFYIMIVCYIYFTRIIVYLLKITVPFQYEWLDELFKELATFIFFVVTGFKFRPASNNPYLQVSTESDEEVEMDEVVTKSGALDDVVRVNVKSKPEEPAGGPSKRESSHDYD